MPSKSFKLVCFSHLFREANQIAKHLAGIATCALRHRDELFFFFLNNNNNNVKKESKIPFKEKRPYIKNIN